MEFRLDLWKWQKEIWVSILYANISRNNLRLVFCILKFLFVFFNLTWKWFISFLICTCQRLNINGCINFCWVVWISCRWGEMYEGFSSKVFLWNASCILKTHPRKLALKIINFYILIFFTKVLLNITLRKLSSNFI